MSSTYASRAGSLPQELTSFVGRRRESASVRRLLSASRLVTLTGPGGVGKTRLALRVASDVRRVFPDGVWLVELDQLRDPALLAHSVAATLDMRELSGRPLLTALVEYLAQRRVLLVLDNCEHLVEACAVLANTLLRACPQLRILATSREPLGSYGEATLRVPSMSVPDLLSPSSPYELSRFEAVTLFADRAAATVPGFGITTDNQTAVAEICRRLDGLPLAIELSAARLRTLSAADIAHRLGDRYRLLNTGPRGAPERQKTLRSCIQWSYDLCSPREQLLWARVAVFTGSFELDAAERVCAGGDLDPDDVLDLVASLVDKSILIREEHGGVVWYRLLETIRGFGRERLEESGEHTALRRRHRDWCGDLVARAQADWIGPRQTDWLARFDREHPNIRAALEFFLTEPGTAQTTLRMPAALYWYWTARGLFSEGRHWLDQVLSTQASPPAERAKILYTDSMLAEVHGDHAAASALVEEGGELAERLGDASLRATAKYAAGMVALYGGNLSRAVECYAVALDAFHAESDVQIQLQNLFMHLETLFSLVLASGLLGQPERAQTYHEELLAITEPRGEVWYRSYSLWALGVAVWRQGSAPAARRAAGLLEQSLRLNRDRNEPLGTAWCLGVLAWIAAQEHHSRRAATLLGAVEALSQTMAAPTAALPVLADCHQQCERQTRQALGAQAFEAAFHHGMNLSVEDAVTYALGGEPLAPAAPRASEETALTRRERQVAELVAEGLSNREIAVRLVISLRTAEAHVEHILVKLGFTSRTKIAAWMAHQSVDAQHRLP